MSPHVLVWDLETVPDLEGYAAANGLKGQSAETIRADIGDKFPKPVYHSIVCIGALIAEKGVEGWRISALGAPHVGGRSEKEIISSFVGKIGELRPQLVTFNGSSFDLPVVRYRAMIHKIAASGLSARNYFNRFSGDALDLCDVLSSFGATAKLRLNELARALGLPGKPNDIDGSQVETLFRAGKVQEIADYCVSDVINTYRIWLRYELFRGVLSEADFERSEQFLEADLGRRGLWGPDANS
jgi:predicted PolB exonuclease-like 3'-5' exonuclease